jgi:hypothetical protein
VLWVRTRLIVSKGSGALGIHLTPFSGLSWGVLSFVKIEKTGFQKYGKIWFFLLFHFLSLGKVWGKNCPSSYKMAQT